MSSAWVQLLHIIFHTAPNLHHSNPWTSLCSLNQFPFFCFENLLKKLLLRKKKKCQCPENRMILKSAMFSMYLMQEKGKGWIL